jgi:UDP-N-acetylglucosamine:LPS N-acetylglucosamine transferase
MLVIMFIFFGGHLFVQTATTYNFEGDNYEQYTRIETSHGYIDEFTNNDEFCHRLVICSND